MVIVKFLKGLRNHWKKSVFAAAAVTYGASEAKSTYDISNLMRIYCTEAATYGDMPHNIMYQNRKLIVLLNPAANKKTAEKTFKKYCDPILQLAGYIVEIVQTDSEGHAKRYIEELDVLPDAILVAGGDGTVSEVVTGLMRRQKSDKCPIGILPVGKINSTASKYFNLPSKSNDLVAAHGLANTAIAVLRGKVERKDILEVQPLSDENAKPIYALNSMQWGAYRDVKSLQDKYWYVGPLREYAAVLFNSFSNKLNWECRANLIYSPPCQGCSNCYIPDVQASAPNKSWFTGLLPTSKQSHQNRTKIDFSKAVNEDCSKEYTKNLNSSEIIISTVKDNEGQSRVVVKSQIPVEYGLDFVSKSWERINSEHENEIAPNEVVECRTVSLIPQQAENETESDKFYYIDNEEYDVRPIKIRLIPNAIDVYSL